MRFLLLALAVMMGCSGCKDCNKVENPVSPDYPCGTRAHPCSMKPLTCCWNNEVCGGPVGSGCPAGYCCYIGNDYGVVTPSSQPSALPPPKQQWTP